jgi:hypothetical protein
LEYNVEITEAALADAENYVWFLEEDRQEPGVLVGWRDENTNTLQPTDSTSNIA